MLLALNNWAQMINTWYLSGSKPVETKKQNKKQTNKKKKKKKKQEKTNKQTNKTKKENNNNYSFYVPVDLIKIGFTA